MGKIVKNLNLIFLLFLVAAVATIWYADLYFERHQNLLIDFFNVGQGDAIFIEVPNGNQILIDGGPNGAILSKLGEVMPFWDRSIDLLVLTHPHADHVSGLVEVLRRYKVGMILESGEEYSTPEYREWRDLIKEKNIPVVIARRGQMAHLGRDSILYDMTPFDDYNGVSVKNPHDANVSTRIVYGQVSALFMGDAEKPIEYRMLNENPSELKSDILKVGHHGSKTSSSQEFLQAVLPGYAVISVGRNNRYGHPHQEVLDRLKKFGIQIFRTDLNGDVVIESDGLAYKIK